MKNILIISFLVLTNLLVKGQFIGVNFSFSTPCVGQSVQFNDLTISDFPIVEWEWDFDALENPGSFTSNIRNPLFVFTSDTKNYIVTLKVKDVFGNIDSNFRIVRPNPSPSITIGTKVNCFPDGVEFSDNSTITSGVISSREWSQSGGPFLGVDKNFTQFFSQTGNYVVVLRSISSEGCESTDSVSVNYSDPPTFQFIPSKIVNICEGDSTLVSVSGANRIEWDFGSNDVSNYFNTQGFYPFTAYNDDDCFSRDSIEVRIAPLPIANAGEDQKISIGESIILQGAGGNSYLWSPSRFLNNPATANPLSTPLETITYTLIVTNNFGCRDSAQVTLEVELNVNYAIPNLITPNGDGFNDVWDLSFIPGIEKAEIFVLNRYGWEVFKTKEYKNDWNGKFNGEILPDGAYVYIIDFKNPDRQIIRGVLNIMKN